MAHYDRRDLIGHWIEREQRTQQPCTHACCRGYRVHPANYPVILPRRVLRRASDHDLADHYDKVAKGDSPQDRYAEAQILAEFQRRDDETRARRQRQEAVAGMRAARQMEREAEGERIRREAEEYTRGYLVTARGRARGISDEEILSGRERIFIEYATPEAKEFFATNPRPTGAYFRGRDTRIRYSDPGSRRRRPKI